MKPPFSWLGGAAFAAAAVFVAVATTPSASAQTIRIATEGAYAPWNFLDDNGDLAGFEVSLGNELCERMNRECQFIANEWDTIIPNLIAGNYDVIMAGMSITEERKEAVDFTQDYFPPDPSRFAAASGESFDFDSLSGVKIGVQGATIQADYIEKNLGDENTVLAYETFDQSVADLAAGNLDLLFADGSALDPVVDSSGGDIVFMGEGILIGGGVAAAMRKADDELETAFNEALVALKADGTLDALIADWFEGKGPFYNN